MMDVSKELVINFSFFFRQPTQLCCWVCDHFTGSVWTASAHIITAVIGSGVLSLAWAVAQLGWVAGPIVMLLFSLVTYYTSALLADCYRSGDPIAGKRNYTYMDAVQANLGIVSKIIFLRNKYIYTNCLHNYFILKLDFGWWRILFLIYIFFKQKWNWG